MSDALAELEDLCFQAVTPIALVACEDSEDFEIKILSEYEFGWITDEAKQLVKELEKDGEDDDEKIGERMGELSDMCRRLLPEISLCAGGNGGADQYDSLATCNLGRISELASEVYMEALAAAVRRQKAKGMN